MFSKSAQLVGGANLLDNCAKILWKRYTCNTYYVGTMGFHFGGSKDFLKPIYRRRERRITLDSGTRFAIFGRKHV